MHTHCSRLIAALAVAAACPSVAGAQTVQAASGPVRAPFRGIGGADLGAAELKPAPTGVLIRVELRGLAPGWHAIHIHDKGDCSDPKFQSAGGHVHAAGQTAAHGLLNPAGPESGDLPNIFVGPDGEGRAELFTDRVSLNGGAGRSGLFDADGSALVVHEKPDDHLSQPIGGAGGRVACAVMAPSSAARR